MPVRLNPIAPLPQQAGDIAGESQNNTSHTTLVPTRQASEVASSPLQRRARSLPQSNAFQAQAQRPRLATLNAAIDQWGAAHGGRNIEATCRAIKEVLRKNFFSGVESREQMQELNLRGKGLHSIPAEIGQAKTLQKLDLYFNELTALPREIGHAEALQELNLGANKITSFPGEMTQAKALRMLNLECNMLTSFPGEMGQASGLQELNLSSNQLTSFPAEMSQITALKRLDVSENQLTDFPGEMSQASGLQELNLSRNQLTSFPAEMSQSKSLRTLDLADNQLSNFPVAMRQVATLRELKLNNNQLTDFTAEMVQAKALKLLDLAGNQLTTFPLEMGQATALLELNLNSNRLIAFPAEMAQVKSLEVLTLADNQLTSFPTEMGQAAKLRQLNLSGNQLTDFPAGMAQAKTLEALGVANNRLTSFPAEMGQVKTLEELDLSGNQLTDLPHEITQLPNLHHLDLTSNHFTQVPRSFLLAPEDVEIDLRDNPLPEEEIQAVHAAMEQRRAAGQSVPALLLPPLADEAGGLREAVANNMNVHTGVLTDAFKKQLDELTLQFPDDLTGTKDAQRAQLKAIEERLTHALDAHAQQYQQQASDLPALRHAREMASLMFQKGQGVRAAYVNEFQHSAGHVLGYTFLALEAQWARTPEVHQAEARRNGMDALIGALDSGSGMCDTRLCEEVLQTIGVPLSDYAQTRPEVVGIQPAQIGIDESRDIIVEVAKQVLGKLLDANPALSSELPPPAWRSTMIAKMREDHPRLPAEQVAKQVQEIESAWETFHDMVVEQRGVV